MTISPIIFVEGYVSLKDWWRVGFHASVANLAIWIPVWGCCGGRFSGCGEPLRGDDLADHLRRGLRQPEGLVAGRLPASVANLAIWIPVGLLWWKILGLW